LDGSNLRQPLVDALRDVLLAPLHSATSRAAARSGRAWRAISPRSASIWFCSSSRLRRSCAFSARSRRPALVAPALRLDALAQVQDGAARLVVLEQRGRCARRGRHSGQRPRRMRGRSVAWRFISGRRSRRGGSAPRRLRRCPARRLFLAEAHGLDLAVLHAQQAERAAHGLGAALAQRQVVFAAAALVGVAFDRPRAAPLALRKRACASISDWNSGLTT
jgi:hypothetical protein